MFGDSNSFWENTPRKYFDRDFLDFKCNTIDEDSTIKNKRINSEVKFSDWNRSSPLKENFNDSAIPQNFSGLKQPFREEKYLKGHIHNSENALLNVDKNKYQNFVNSLKYKKASQKLHNYANTNETYDRKWSEQLHNKIDLINIK